MVSPVKPLVCIVTPGTRSANNGNWRTAARWAGFLRDRSRVIVQTEWDGRPADALIALHAKRSAASIQAFREKLPHKRVAVMLTGTDLYRDLPESAEARASLDTADAIVTLQDDARRLLAPAWRSKAIVIYQSAAALARARKKAGRLNCVVVGHLRAEKDPSTLFGAIRRLPAETPIFFRHIGAPLDAKLGDAARALAASEPRYRYSGALPHGLTRAAVRAAHLLVHPSIMEGGANVVVEAVTAGTPVLASRISGNIGMLGARYPGYFEPRDEDGLARLLVRALEEREYLHGLGRACAERAPLFRPQAEARAVRDLVTKLVASGR